ncbi:MAG: cyclic nucleotide-binding domain-containing protein [Leptolyngbya sp. SIO4C1]|nr:cyclic nucleotide-binding domain-containing protein [Leptolyngbya sp. SIO4C1]
MKRVLYVLGTLDDDDIDWLVAIGQRQEIAPSEVLIEAEQPVGAVYLILEGQFAVCAEVSQPPIAYLGSGEVTGEMSFIDTYPASAVVKAMEPGLVLAIPREQLAAKLKQDICFAARFYEAMAILLSMRLRGTLKQIHQPLEPATEVTSYTLTMSDKRDLGAVRYNWLLRRLRHEVFEPI